MLLASWMRWITTVLTVGFLCFSKAQKFDGKAVYSRSQELHEGYMLYWTLDTEAQLIHIGIEVAAQGWVGFGISEVGGMKGADIFYFETETGVVVDTYATAYAQPMVDDCQDWVFRSGGVQDGKLYLEVSREFDTGDTQDWKLVDDTGTNGHRFIAAWGDSVSFGYHGTDNRDSGKIHFFGAEPPVDQLQTIKDLPGVEFRDILYENWTIPDVTTKYHDVCWNVQELMGLESADEAYHVVAFEPILNPADWKYMHHVTISGSTEVSDSRVKHEGFCKRKAHGDGALVMAWAGEKSSIILPSQAGIRILGEGWRSFGVQTHFNNPAHHNNLKANSGYVFFSSFFVCVIIHVCVCVCLCLCERVQTHFNNPAHHNNLKANSGIRVWYTKTLRPMDVGVMQIGDPGVVLSYWENVEMEGGWHSVHTNCPSKFTNQFVVPEVTVFARFMHMHLVGERFEARLKRGGELVRVDSTEVYDGLKSGGFDPMSTGPGFKVKKGDTFEVDCYYRVPQGQNVKFGQGTEDEMCIDFLWYYPKQPIKGAEACVIHGSNEGEYLGRKTHANASETGRVFGLSPPHCTEPPTNPAVNVVQGSGASGWRGKGGRVSGAMAVTLLFLVAAAQWT